MTKKRHKKKILLDADVIIHFVKADKVLLLPKIFKEEKVILDIVSNELKKKKSLQIFYDNLVNFRLIREITFQSDFKVIQEYARLKKQDFGDGESACMAYCKFNKDILASSNLRDIADYCKDNQIEYVTTMDFLYKAYEDGLMTESECDEFIYNVKSKGSKLPFDTIEQFIK